MVNLPFDPQKIMIHLWLPKQFSGFACPILTPNSTNKPSTYLLKQWSSLPYTFLRPFFLDVQMNNDKPETGFFFYIAGVKNKSKLSTYLFGTTKRHHVSLLA